MSIQQYPGNLLYDRCDVTTSLDRDSPIGKAKILCIISRSHRVISRRLYAFHTHNEDREHVRNLVLHTHYSIRVDFFFFFILGCSFAIVGIPCLLAAISRVDSIHCWGRNLLIFEIQISKTKVSISLATSFLYFFSSAAHASHDGQCLTQHRFESG